MPVAAGAQSTSSAVSSIVSGRSYSERCSRGAAAGAVHRRARLAERDGGAAAGAAGRAGHERHLALQRVGHQLTRRPRAPGRSFGPGRSARARRPEHQRAAGELDRAERLAEDEEGQHHGDHRLDGRQDRGARRADAAQPGEEEADRRRPSRRPRCSASQPKPAALTAPGVQLAEQRRAERSGVAAAPVHTSAREQERADARGDALADEDVGAVDDRGRRARARRRAGRARPRPRRPARARARPRRAPAPRPARARRARARARSRRR